MLEATLGRSARGCNLCTFSTECSPVANSTIIKMIINCSYCRLNCNYFNIHSHKSLNPRHIWFVLSQFKIILKENQKHIDYRFSIQGPDGKKVDLQSPHSGWGAESASSIRGGRDF